MTTVTRRDGRGPCEMRGKELRASDLSQFDGSVWYSQGLTAVCVAINGPTAARQENYRRCTLNVRVSRMSRIPPAGGTDRLAVMEKRERQQRADGEMEQFLAGLAEAVVQLDRFPRCVLEVNVMVLMDDGALLAVAANAMMCALLDAGVPCHSTVAAVSLLLCVPAKTEDEETPVLLLDPTAAEESTDEVRSYAAATFVLMNSSDGVVASDVHMRPRSSAYSRPVTPKELNAMIALAAKATETIFTFFRNCGVPLE
ncbi:unnamed protein product [Trypanosoma congolense IL3000]|uniref:WGS project CAEQ00000000 data, annotated contig 2213 n=1 Tax=Trypanosoma congolense (strain IL3000) TaxID=1068625 RepID=F9WCC2_TRYCI|nr:unnamed protein product [Trypanosoma congolense IL3000]